MVQKEQKHSRCTDKEWLELIQECHTSGMSDKDWCLPIAQQSAWSIMASRYIFTPYAFVIMTVSLEPLICLFSVFIIIKIRK